MSRIDELNIKSKEIFSDFLFNYVVDFIQNKMSSEKSAKWVSKDINHKFHSDLCFVYKNNVYSVLLDIREEPDRISLKDVAIKFHISEAKKNGFRPCIFPVVEAGEQIKCVSDGWNLFDTETNEQINPDDIEVGKKQEVSDWGLECYGVNYLKEYLESQGCKIFSIQTISKEEPQIWYKDEDGNKSYVIVHLENVEEDDDTDEITNEIINNYKKNNGYEATLGIRPSGKNKKLCYGDELDININYYIRINKAESTDEQQQNPFENADIYSLLLSSSETKNISDKKNIKIFYLKDYKGYLLKTQTAIVSNINIITKDLIAIPYKYEENIKNNPHYGLPLYYITAKSSKYANQKFIDPQDEDLVEKSKTNILKQIFGENITNKYRYQFFILYGESQDKEVALELQKIFDIKNKYGINTAGNVINWLNKGIYNYAPNQLKRGSVPYKFIPNANFSLIYYAFKENYLDNLRLLSEFPQISYENAVKCIIEPKNFVFNFLTPSNIIADYDTKQFSFINFVFDKSLINQTNNDIQLKQFKNALIGSYENIAFQPYEILFLQADIKKFNEYKQIITEKIEKAMKEVY